MSARNSPSPYCVSWGVTAVAILLVVVPVVILCRYTDNLDSHERHVDSSCEALLPLKVALTQERIHSSQLTIGSLLHSTEHRARCEHLLLGRGACSSPASLPGFHGLLFLNSSVTRMP